MATSFFGSLLSAWRKQVPKRAPGKSVHILLTVLSKPSVRIPRTRYDGSEHTPSPVTPSKTPVLMPFTMLPSRRVYSVVAV